MAKRDREVWCGCYRDGNPWKGLLHPEAYEHPGRFSRGLIERIADCMIENGWAGKASGAVLDPFAGAGCGGVVFSNKGVQWVGVELEPRHAQLAEMTFGMYVNYRKAFDDPCPEIIRGDSRELVKVLREHKYLRAFDSVVGSPPYIGTLKDGGGNEGAGAHGEEGRRGRDNATSRQGIGNSEGQMSAMPAGDITSVVSSPPYEATQLDQIGPQDDRVKRMREKGFSEEKIRHTTSNAMKAHYGTTEGQLCATRGDTFWSAAAVILRQCHEILPPGGVSVWVTQEFVKDGAKVDFPGQWADLVESCGFIIFKEVMASRTKEERHPSLFGGEEVTRTRTTSMWRKLDEKKRPELTIEGEVVTFARKN